MGYVAISYQPKRSDRFDGHVRRRLPPAARRHQLDGANGGSEKGGCLQRRPKTRVLKKRFVDVLKASGCPVNLAENFAEVIHGLGPEREAFSCVTAEGHQLELALDNFDLSLPKGILFLSQKNDTTQTHWHEQMTKTFRTVTKGLDKKIASAKKAMKHDDTRV